MSAAVGYAYSVVSGGAVYGGQAAPFTQPALGAYRSTQEWLFADVTPTATPLGVNGYNVMETPARVGAGIQLPVYGFPWGGYGPGYLYVENTNQWAWTNPGGDWINSAGTSQATSLPHFTFTANSATSGSASYTANITAGVQASQVGNRWNAYIVKCVGGSRSLASRHHLTLAPPSVSVVYADSTTATLACTACTRMASGTAYTFTGRPDAAIVSAVALEFERPTKAVVSATLSVRVTDHTSTAATISGYLANPPATPGSIIPGMASGYPGDAGLGSASGVLVAHRYTDGTTLTDWVVPGGVGVWNKAAWDPEVLGTGAADITKLPTAYSGTQMAGKWVRKQASGDISLVSSSYTGDGFVPLSPGSGALRISVPAGTGVDGTLNGGNGSLGSDLWLLFPKALCGTDALKRTFVRWYVRMSDKAQLLADTKMYGQSGTTAYATMYGKWGIGVHHWMPDGGNNQFGGGGYGWGNRLGYGVSPKDAPIAGISSYMHSLDNFADHHDMAWDGGNGAGSALYPGRWYCIEVECNLNTMTLTGGSPSDGVMRVWLDGRLVMVNSGWQYRDGPLYTSTDPTRLTSFRQMGPIGLALNHYQGGVLMADRDFICFYDGVVCSTSYIGPMAQ